MEEKVEGYWKRKFGDVERHGISAFAMAFLFLLQSIWDGFSLVCLITAFVFAGLGLAVIYLRKPKRDRDDLKTVEIDLMTLSGLKFNGSDIKFKWTDLSFVKFNESKKGKSSVEFVGKGIRTVVSQDVFENFDELHETLKRRIPRKRVRVEERDVDGPEKRASIVEEAPTIIKDRARAAPKQLFQYVIWTGYIALLVVVFMGWGLLEGCLVSLGLWAIILAAWVYVPGRLATKSLGEIRFTREGAIGTTFDGKKSEIAWKDVLNVVIHFPPSTGGWQRHAGRIAINGESIKLGVGLQFPKFGLLASHLNEICLNRGIRVFTKGSPIVAHKPLEEKEKRELEKLLGQNREDREVEED